MPLNFMQSKNISISQYCISILTYAYNYCGFFADARLKIFLLQFFFVRSFDTTRDKYSC